MSLFKLKSQLPLTTRKEIDRVSAIAAGQRNSVEAAFIAGIDQDYLYNEVITTNAAGEIILAQGHTVPTGDSGFAVGAIFIKSNAAVGEQGVYQNLGDATASAWGKVGGGIVLSGEYTTAGGSTDEVAEILGVKDGDSIIATIKTPHASNVTLSSVAVTDDDEVTFVFNTDPVDDTILSYVIFRP